MNGEIVKEVKDYYTGSNELLSGQDLNLVREQEELFTSVHRNMYVMVGRNTKVSISIPHNRISRILFDGYETYTLSLFLIPTTRLIRVILFVWSWSGPENNSTQVATIPEVAWDKNKSV